MATKAPTGKPPTGKACWQGDTCPKPGCKFLHPHGEERIGLEPVRNTPCRFERCTRPGCLYKHPPASPASSSGKAPASKGKGKSASASSSEPKGKVEAKEPKGKAKKVGFPLPAPSGDKDLRILQLEALLRQALDANEKLRNENKDLRWQNGQYAGMLDKMLMDPRS